MALGSYRELAEDLGARLQRGEWTAGGAIPSLRALARCYGVGIQVVRSAVGQLQAEGRLVALPGRGVYVREGRSGAALAGNLVLEIVLPELAALMTQGSYYVELQAGIQQGMGRLGSPLLIAHSDSLSEGLTTSLRSLPLRAVLVIGHLSQAGSRALERLPWPVVLVDQPSGPWRLHAVAVDNAGAAREAARNLLALGHRRIAFLSAISVRKRDIDPDSRERLAGFKAELALAGLRPHSVAPISSHDRPGDPPFQALLRARPRATAVVAADSHIATRLRQTALKAGLALPRNLSIACFDALTSAPGGFSGPRMDFYELGKQAALLAAEPRRPARHVRIPAVWTDEGTVCGLDRQ